MPLSHEFHNELISDIQVSEDRQRKDVGDLNGLKASIAAVGLLNPLVVDRGLGLVAGFRRLQACRELGFTMVPVHFYDELSYPERVRVELEENIKRKQLNWKEEASAVALFCSLAEGQTQDQISEHLGVGTMHLTRCVAVADALRRGDESVHAAESISAAYHILDRIRQRQIQKELSTLDLDSIFGPKPEPTFTPDTPGDDTPDLGTPPEPAAPRVRAAELDIIVGNFVDWADNYNGPKFNFIHCDFPYGINLQLSDQANAQEWGAYRDTPEIYWELTNTLCARKERLFQYSSHLMFWFSMKYYEQTCKTLEAAGFRLLRFPLIWLKTDGRGILPDPNRGPRQIYETALMASLGDRPIIRAVGNAYGAPTGKADATHLSQKPAPVLRHFFQMFVDETSSVLDPTCGSGTALLVADEMGAERVFGMDISEEHANGAQDALRASRNMRGLSL